MVNGLELVVAAKNIDDLVQSIRMYDHVSDVRKGEYTLLDLLKNEKCLYSAVSDKKVSFTANYQRCFVMRDHKY